MTIPDFPTDITERERDLGFELIQIRDPCGMGMSSAWVSVVAKILSDSDIVIKTFLPSGDARIYKHRRFGVMAGASWEVYDAAPTWNSVGDGLFTDPQQAITRSRYDSDEIASRSISPSKFVFRRTIHPMER